MNHDGWQQVEWFEFHLAGPIAYRCPICHNQLPLQPLPYRITPCENELCQATLVMQGYKVPVTR